MIVRYRCTATTAFGRKLPEILEKLRTDSDNFCTSILRVEGSTSMTTGVAPLISIAAAVATAVWETVNTASPEPTLSERSARLIASVPFATPMTLSTFNQSANSLSNRVTSSPRMYQPLLKTRLMRASSSPRYCR